MSAAPCHFTMPDVGHRDQHLRLLAKKAVIFRPSVKRLVLPGLQEICNGVRGEEYGRHLLLPGFDVNNYESPWAVRLHVPAENSTLYFLPFVIGNLATSNLLFSVRPALAGLLEDAFRNGTGPGHPWPGGQGLEQLQMEPEGTGGDAAADLPSSRR